MFEGPEENLCAPYRAESALLLGGGPGALGQATMGKGGGWGLGWDTIMNGVGMGFSDGLDAGCSGVMSPREYIQKPPKFPWAQCGKKLLRHGLCQRSEY